VLALGVVAAGLVVAGLAVGLAEGLAEGLGVGLAEGLAAGLAVGLAAGLAVGLVAGDAGGGEEAAATDGLSEGFGAPAACAVPARVGSAAAGIPPCDDDTVGPLDDVPAAVGVGAGATCGATAGATAAGTGATRATRAAGTYRASCCAEAPGNSSPGRTTPPARPTPSTRT
jgi:hypothetical protein